MSNEKWLKEKELSAKKNVLKDKRVEKTDKYLKDLTVFVINLLIYVKS